MSQSDLAGDGDASQLACSICGQPHSPEENHTYSYQEEVDDDIICHICLQPLILPIDTPCGHTYCTVCLTNFLLEKDFCPVDRAPLMLQTCKKSNILVNKLLDKLLVTCPLTEHCSEILQRCDLEPHLKNRCKGASHYGLSGDRKRHSLDGDCTDCTSELTVATLPSELPDSAAVASVTDDPGLVNPAFDPNVEDSQSDNSSLPTRSNTKKIRNLDRSSMRSKSFKQLNRAFSVLRRTRSGTAVVNESAEERDNVRNANAPEEDFALPQLHNLIPDGEITSIKINRSNPSEALAISIVGGNETPLVCILIQDVYREGIIARDGRLLPGDVILKASEGRVQFIVSRQTRHQTPDILQDARWNTNSSPPPYPTEEKDSASKNVLHNFTCQEKIVSLTKETCESLGMTVAGGKLSRGWDLPIYIASVDPDGVVGRDGRIKKGDFLLSVNDIELMGVTRSEAVTKLKSMSSVMVLRALEMREWDDSQAQSQSPSDANEKLSSNNEDWSPSWVTWLQLPRHHVYEA
ncbi:UNVERIFIED_CONTAM: hypothetical protein FKN15_048921 [Acipenser sinensis]